VLEVVEVEQRQADGVLVAGGPHQLARKLFVPPAPVEHPRQRIGAGLLGQPAHQLAALEQRADSGFELLAREGLHHIVVGARLEAAGGVIAVRKRRQQQDRNFAQR
jgi:hypothetical protein